MFNQLIQQLEAVIRNYGAVGVFFAALTEEIIAPIPSAFIAMMSGFFLIDLELGWTQALPATFFMVAIPMALGMTLGSIIVYGACYFGGKPFIEKYGKWLSISWQGIERAEATFSQGRADEWVMLGARILPVVPSVAISAFAGLIRYRFKTFVLLALFGGVIRSFIMGLIGWQARDAYSLYAERVDHLESIGTIITVIVLVAAAAYWYMAKRKK